MVVAVVGLLVFGVQLHGSKPHFNRFRLHAVIHEVLAIVDYHYLCSLVYFVPAESNAVVAYAVWNWIRKKKKQLIFLFTAFLNQIYSVCSTERDKTKCGAYKFTYNCTVLRIQWWSPTSRVGWHYMTSRR